MQIEQFQWNDTSQIVEMICEVWQLDKMFGHFKNGMIFSQEYLYDVLKQATDVYVAKENQSIVGFLALAITSQDKIKIPDTYQCH